MIANLAAKNARVRPPVTSSEGWFLRPERVAMLYFPACRLAKASRSGAAHKSGIETGFRAREVVLSQNEVVDLLAFGSTSEYELEKFVWWMKRGISSA